MTLVFRFLTLLIVSEHHLIATINTILTAVTEALQNSIKEDKKTARGRCTAAVVCLCYRVLLVPGHAANAASSAELTAESPETLHSWRSRVLCILLHLLHRPKLQQTVWVWHNHHIYAHLFQSNGCIYMCVCAILHQSRKQLHNHLSVSAHVIMSWVYLLEQAAVWKQPAWVGRCFPVCSSPLLVSSVGISPTAWSAAGPTQRLNCFQTPPLYSTS